MKSGARLNLRSERGVRPSTNNIQYDHWFRFDLSISDETLKKIFTDIFEIYDWEGINIALEPVEYRSLPLILDRYLTQPRVSKEKPIYKKTSQTMKPRSGSMYLKKSRCT